MSDTAPARVRIDLTPPQVVTQTSALLYEPRRGTGLDAVVLAPGAGTDLLHPVLLEVAKGLAQAGHPVLLFNFAFTEAGRKSPDPAPRLERAYGDVVAWVRHRYGEDRGVLMGGRSLGGRIASHLAAGGVDCAGLILLGYPLHPRKRPNADTEQLRLRTGHWPDLKAPMLFVQGDRDALCDLDVFARERAHHLSGVPTELHVVRGGDHAFAVRARDRRSAAEVLDEVRGTVVRWVRQLELTATAG